MIESAQAELLVAGVLKDSEVKLRNTDSLKLSDYLKLLDAYEESSDGDLREMVVRWSDSKEGYENQPN